MPHIYLLTKMSDESMYRSSSSKCVHLFTDQKGSARHLAFHPGGNWIAAGTSDSKVKVFDVRMKKLQQLYSSHEDAVTQVLRRDFYKYGKRSIFLKKDRHQRNVI